LEKIKGLDILKEIQKSAGRRMKLSQLAEGTLGVGKSGSGLEAILWWKNGEIEKIRKYCLDDVRITRDLYNYALKNNKLIFKEGGRMNEIKLDTSEWEMPAADSVMNRTLPF
jgi:DEAD/DEAH box helicase domain-containing protein